MSMGRSSTNRRRQRSVRVTVSVLCLGLATLVVLASLPTRSALWTSLAAVAAMVLAWASLRIMWTEVLQTRRDTARERAHTAAAYQQLFAERAVEHAEFTEAITDRLATSQLALRETSGQRDAAVRRAQAAESRSIADARRLVETQQRLHTVEKTLADRETELVQAREVALAAWDEATNGSGDADLSKLISWAHDSAAAPADQRKRA